MRVRRRAECLIDISRRVLAREIVEIARDPERRARGPSNGSLSAYSSVELIELKRIVAGAGIRNRSRRVKRGAALPARRAEQTNNRTEGEGVWLGGRESLLPFWGTPRKTTNCRATLWIATIERFLILALACVRSLPFSVFSGAMTLGMSLATIVSRGSLGGTQPS